MAGAVVGSMRVVLGIDSAQFDAGVRRAMDRTRILGQSFGALDGSARGARGGLQNLSFQIQDFAVQVSSGTDASRALAQQLPQLLSGFGAIGAVVGAAAAVIVPLAGHLLSTGEAAETAEEQLKSLASATEALSDAVSRANQSPLQLAETYGIQIGQARELLRIEAELAAQRARAELADSAGRADELSGRWARMAEDGVRPLIDALSELNRLERELEAARRAGNDEAVAAIQEQIYQTRTAQAGLLTAIRNVEQLGETMGIVGREDAARLAQALAAVDDSIDPQEQARAWQRVREELIRAVGGVEMLNEEALALVGHATAAENAALRLAAEMIKISGFDISTPFADALAVADRLVSKIQEGLGSLQSWGGAIGDFVAGFGANNDLTGLLSGQTDGLAAAMDLIKQFEGFRNTAYWDVNAFRAGFGSDTVTLADGSIRQITEGMYVARVDAERDLERRTREFAAIAMREVGADRWAQLIPAQQAVLTSIAYNYGNLPDAVARAVREGSATQVAAAIRALGGDNGGINGNRRNQEAAIFVTEIGAETAALRERNEAVRAATEAEREAERIANEAAQRAARELGLREDLLAASDRAAQDAEFELSLVGKTAEEQARLRTAYELTNQALANGIDLNETIAGTTQTYGERIEEAAQAASRAVGEQERLAAAQDAAAQAAQDAAAEMEAFVGQLTGMALGPITRNPIGRFLSGLPGFQGGAESVIGGFMNGGFGGAASAIGTALSGATSGLAGLGTAIGAIAAPIGAAIGIFNLFRGTTEKLDSGIRVTIKGMDALVQTFEKTRTTRFAGLFSNTSTDLDSAPGKIADPVERAYRDLYRSVTGMARSLGVGRKAFEDFSFYFNVSLEGMTNEQKVQAVTEQFGRVSDKLARMAGVSSGMIREGETATQALERMGTALQTANGIMEMLGGTLYKTSLTGADAASRLIDAFGGLQAAAQAVDSYFQNFYSLPERLQANKRQLNRALDDLGIERIPTSLQDFRRVVDSLMDRGQKGRAAGLIALADDFMALLDLRDQLAQAGDAGGLTAAALQEREGLQRRLWDLQGNTVALRKAELAALDPANRALLRQIWALEKQQRAADKAAAAAERAADRDERRENRVQQIAERAANEREGLQRRIWELEGNTAAIRKMELRQLLPANRALLRRLWALEKEARITEEREGLETRLLELQGNTAALRALELKELMPANRAQQIRIWALEDEAKIADERKGLEERLLDLQGNTAELRRRELEALNPANRALLEMIHGLEDAKEAMEALEATDFASKFDFDRSRGIAANGRTTSTGIPLTVVPGNPVLVAQQQQATAIQDLNDRMTQLLIKIEGHTAGTRQTLRQWNADGMPAERSA